MGLEFGLGLGLALGLALGLGAPVRVTCDQPECWPERMVSTPLPL